MPTTAELDAIVASRGGADQHDDLRHRPRRRDAAHPHRRAVGRPAPHPRHRPSRGGRPGLRRPPAPGAASLSERGHAVPRRGRPPGPRFPRAPAATRWRWPTDGPCWPGSSRRCEHPDVDGVLGSPDIVEELLLLGALEGKVVIGSMNRGGLDGATLDDGRPVHRVRRGQHRRVPARGRQDAAAHRRPGPLHRRDARRVRDGRERAGRPRPAGHGRAAALPPRGRRHPHPAQGRASTGPRCHHRQRPGHHQCLHVAEDALLRRPGDRVRGDDTAVRRPRRRAEPRPGAGPRVVGSGADPAHGPRPGRRPGPALSARRGRACCRRRGCDRARCRARSEAQ